MAGCPCQPVLDVFCVFMVVRVLVRVFFSVHMRMWVFVCILAVMRVRMDMFVLMYMAVFLLCIPIVHAHHRLSDFYILLFFVPCRKPPRGMKFERDFRST